MTWNVNSLRNAVSKMSEIELEVLNSFDILMLQETKMGRSKLENINGINWEKFDSYGVDFPHITSGRGLGLNGVAILVNSRIRAEPSYVSHILPDWTVTEMEGRYLELHYEKLVLINAYFPSASRGKNHRIPYKEKFSYAVLERSEELKNKGMQVLLGADFNVAAEKIDINPKVAPLVSSGFRNEERNWLNKLTSVLDDSWRIMNKNKISYTTWFHYDRRGNKGMRYDGILNSKDLVIFEAQHLLGIGGSDHIPATLHIILQENEQKWLKIEGGSSEYLRKFYIADHDENENFKPKQHLNKNSKVKYAKINRRKALERLLNLTELCCRPDYLPSYIRQFYKDDEYLYTRYLCWSEPVVSGSVENEKEEQEATMNFYPIKSEKEIAKFSEKLDLKENETLIGITQRDGSKSNEKELEAIIRHCSGEEVPVNQALMQDYYEEMIQSGFCRTTEVEYETAKRHFSKFAEVRKTKPKKVADKIRPAAVLLPGGSKPDPWNELREPPTINEEEIRLTEENLNAIMAKTTEKFPGFLNIDEVTYIKRELKPYDKAFSFDLLQKGRLKEDVVAPIKIHTIPHTPWNIRERPIPPAHFKKLIEFLKEKLRAGIMEPSSGSYASPWFVVAKKDGDIRFIQDLQVLNKITIRDSGVVPNMSDLTERASGHRIYSGVDCHSFYDQFVLDKDSRDLTAIRTPLGLMRITGLPQGWTNSVPNAQRVSSMIFHKNGIVEVFMDDVLVFTGSDLENDLFDSGIIPGVRIFVVEHMNHFKEVLEKCLKTGLTIHGVKNDLFVPEILCLGVVISLEGRKINPKKIDAIEKWKVPSNLSELRSFLGLCTVYRMWILAFSVRAYYLFLLYKKGTRYEWGELQQEAYEDLKNAMSTAPVRRSLNYETMKQFPPILGVDAYLVGEGSMLGQEDESGTRFPVAFFSGLFNETERLYPQVKLEACSLVRNLKRCYYYFDGVEKIIVEVDAWALKGMLNNPSVGDRTLLRWLTYILTFPIEIKTIKGKANVIPDYLSRMHSKSPPESEMIDEMNEVEEAIDSMLETAHVSYLSKIYMIEVEMYEEDENVLDIVIWLDSGIFKEERNQSARRKIRNKALKYFLYEGYLFKRGKTEDEVPRRVVVRSLDKRTLIKMAHEGLEGGHFQWERTYQKLFVRYYWKRMQKEVVDYCNGCFTCKVMAKKRYLEPAKFNKSPSTIFMIWYADLIHLPLGVNKQKYIFHLECNLSAWPEAMHFSHKFTKPILTWVKEHVFMRLGLPMVLVVDGGEFDAAEAKIVSVQLGFRIEVIAPYNHKALGAIERAHSPLVGSLAKMCRGRHNVWPRKLNTALFAKRITTTSRGYSPFHIVYGQHPLFPIDFTIDSFFMINWKDNMTTVDLLAARIKQLEVKFQIEKHSKENIDRLRQRAAEYYNKINEHRFRNAAQQIVEGNLVLLFDSSLDTNWGRKFDDRWKGPLKVTRITNGVYYLSELNGDELNRPVSGDRLILYNDLRLEFQDLMAEQVQQNEEDNEYMVEEDEAAFNSLIKNSTQELFTKYDGIFDNRTDEVKDCIVQIMRGHLLNSATDHQVFFTSQGTT